MSADRTSLCQRRASARLDQVVEKPADYFSTWAGTWRDMPCSRQILPGVYRWLTITAQP
jgi:hypothetical protein